MFVFYVSLECLDSCSIVLRVYAALFFALFLQSDVLFRLFKKKKAARTARRGNVQAAFLA